MFLLLLICGREVHIFSHTCSFVCMLSSFLHPCWLCCKNRSPDKAFLNTGIFFGLFFPIPLFFCCFGTSNCPKTCRKEHQRFLLMIAIKFVPLERKPRNVLTQDFALPCPQQSLSGLWKHQDESKQDLRPPFWWTALTFRLWKSHRRAGGVKHTLQYF